MTAGSVDVHGRDARDVVHPEGCYTALADHHRRVGPRHEHLRRLWPRLGHIRVHFDHLPLSLSLMVTTLIRFLPPGTSSTRLDASVSSPRTSTSSPRSSNTFLKVSSPAIWLLFVLLFGVIWYIKFLPFPVCGRQSRICTSRRRRRITSWCCSTTSSKALRTRASASTSPNWPASLPASSKWHSRRSKPWRRRPRARASRAAWARRGARLSRSVFRGSGLPVLHRLWLALW